MFYFRLGLGSVMLSIFVWLIVVLMNFWCRLLFEICLMFYLVDWLLWIELVLFGLNIISIGYY